MNPVIITTIYAKYLFSSSDQTLNVLFTKFYSFKPKKLYIESHNLKKLLMLFDFRG